MIYICRSIRAKVISKFHVQLCLALLLLYLIFLIGIDRIEVEGVCIAMSFLIQYIALVSVFWMGAEALLMMKTFIFDVFGNTSKRFIILISLFCWGKFICFTIIVSESEVAL